MNLSAIKRYIPANIKKYLPLIVIGGLGLASALLIHVYLKNTAKSLADKYASEEDATQIKLVVAAKNLKPGAVISVDNVAVRSIPRKYAHANALQPDQMDGVFGRVILEPLEQGKPLLAAFLERPAPKPFSSRLVAGTRAITLTVDEINTISGLLRAGDHIDLIFTSRPGGSGDNQMVLPLMQDVVVRATGQIMMEEAQAHRPLTTLNDDQRKDRGGYNTITVEATQRDAERLILAQTVGHLTAILRGVGDRDVSQVNRVTMADLTGVKLEPPVIKKPSKITDGSSGVMFLVGGTSGIQRVADGTGGGHADLPGINGIPIPRGDAGAAGQGAMSSLPGLPHLPAK